jgi:mxaJ protein
MSSVFKGTILLALLLLRSVAADEDRVLRIAADPNNLPFSNEKLEGFENRIASLIGQELGMRIEYEWRAQRRGFFRETLKEGNCDMVMGVPAGFERALTTKPYYRSSYVFVSRKDRGLSFSALDDPNLREWKIGVHLIGDDGMNTPPAHALAQRGIVTNLVGFTLYGNYAEPNPPARIIEAVANGSIDGAMVWGPLAGYFAARSPIPLAVVRLPRDNEFPFSFGICIGVKKGKKELRDQIDEVLARKKDEVWSILSEFNVPVDKGS